MMNMNNKKTKKIVSSIIVILLALAMVCVAAAVIRAVYVSVQVHRGRASRLRNARGEQVARKADSLVSVAFFVVAVVLIVWNYVR